MNNNTQLNEQKLTKTQIAYNKFLNLESPMVSDLKNLINDIHINECEIDNNIFTDLKDKFNMNSALIEKLLIPTFTNRVNVAVSGCFHAIQSTNGLTIHRGTMHQLNNAKTEWHISDDNYNSIMGTVVNDITSNLITEYTHGYVKLNHIKSFIHIFDSYVSDAYKTELNNYECITPVSNIELTATLYKQLKSGLKESSIGNLIITENGISYNSSIESVTLKKSLIAGISYNGSLLIVYRTNGKNTTFDCGITSEEIKLINKIYKNI